MGKRTRIAVTDREGIKLDFGGEVGLQNDINDHLGMNRCRRLFKVDLAVQQRCFRGLQAHIQGFRQGFVLRMSG